MNEQIKELVRQSGLYEILNEHAGEFGNGDLTNTPYPELDKFAELIIRECTDILSDYSGKVVFNDHGTQMLQHPIVRIKQHFGVE